MNLGRELTRLGFYQSSFHASLIGRPGADGPADGGVAIERVATAEALEEYLDAYVAGWGIAEKDHAQFKGNVRPWLDQAGWSLYLARVNGRPAAAATLYVRDGIGYLADSATDPSFRRRGLHIALLQRRLRDAGVAGANLVFSAPSRSRLVIAIWNGSACACNSRGQSEPQPARDRTVAMSLRHVSTSPMGQGFPRFRG
jgi:ribosomal protein S18 acetylase RimI-like enzyme